MPATGAGREQLPPVPAMETLHSGGQETGIPEGRAPGERAGQQAGRAGGTIWEAGAPRIGCALGSPELMPSRGYLMASPRKSGGRLLRPSEEIRFHLGHQPRVPQPARWLPQPPGQSAGERADGDTCQAGTACSRISPPRLPRAEPGLQVPASAGGQQSCPTGGAIPGWSPGPTQSPGQAGRGPAGWVLAVCVHDQLDDCQWQAKCLGGTPTSS